MSAESTIRTWMDYGVGQKQRADAAEAALSEMRAELERHQDEEDKAAREMQTVIQGLRNRATAAEAQLERQRKLIERAQAIVPETYTNWHAAALALSQDEPADLGVGG